MSSQAITEFLNASVYAVAGASNDREKYGNRVFRALLASGRTVYPLNPHSKQIEGHEAYARISDLPEVPEALSIVTPPDSTRTVVSDAIEAGVAHIWMQPGAEDEEASEQARGAGISVLDDGSCLLVALSLQDRRGRKDE